MLEDVKQQVEGTLLPLLAGILEDSQKLVRQEISLARVEIKEDLARVKTMAISSSIGIMMGLLATIMSMFALVHLLAYVVPSLPLWGAYAAVGLLLAILALLFLSKAKSEANAIKVVPEKTVNSIKENVEWIQRKI